MKKKQPRKPRKAGKPSTTATPLPESPKETGYNGWTNYETWVVNLWLDNDEGSQSYWRKVAEWAINECRDTISAYAKFTGREPFTLAERATFLVRDALKEQHEQALPDIDGFAADLLNGAMSEVNWYEIAKHLVEGVEQ